MKKALLTAVAACMIAAPMVFAQGQNGSSNGTNNAPMQHQHQARAANPQARVERQVAHWTKALGLNASQQQQATTIFTNLSNSNTPVFADLRTAGRSLGTAVKSNEPANTIKQFSTTIGNDYSQLVANEASAYEQFYQTLTPEQQSKVSQMHRMGFMGGFGGHGTM